MAKITLQDLTNEQLDIVQEVAEMFEISEEEALEQCLADGSVSINVGGGVAWIPEGYKELQYYIPNPKSNLYKANKEYKKAHKKDLIEEDSWLYDVQLPRLLGDDGKKTKDFDIDNAKATVLGSEVELIVTNVLYMAERKMFEADGKTPKPNNFITTMGSSVFQEGQEEMIIKGTKDESIKGKSMYQLVQKLKKEYGTKDKFPSGEGYSFRIVIFGLVKINGKYEKCYHVALNRMADDNLVTNWDKARVGVKSNYLSKMVLKGHDNFENPIFVLEVIKKLSMEDLAKEDLKLIIRDSVNDVKKWQTASIDSAKGGSKNTDTKADTSKASQAEEEEDKISWDD